MADEVQEQMGDILSAFGIPELAQHIVPIPVQPLDDPENEVQTPGKEEEEAGEHADSKNETTADVNAGMEEDNKAEDQAVMDTEDASNRSEPEPDTNSSSQEDVSVNQKESAGQPSAQTMADLGLTQSVAPNRNSSNSESSLIRDLLASTSKPVMTPLLQGTLPRPGRDADPLSSPQGLATSDESASPKQPSTLTSFDEFNSFFDRHKEAQELLQAKKKILGKENSAPAYQCPVLSDEQTLALGMDKETFRCLGCDDTFLFQASLDAHMQRRTVLITFHCKWCKGRQDLVFYNKCNFLTHLGRHKASDSEIEAIKLQATVTPVGALETLKIFTKLTATNKKDDIKMSSTKDNSKDSVLKSVLPPGVNHSPVQEPMDIKPPQKPSLVVVSSDSDESKEGENHDKRVESVTHPGQMVDPVPPSKVQDVAQPQSEMVFLCMGCQQRYDRRENLKHHLQRVISKGPFHQCRVCKMILANSCMVKMHSIIHGLDGSLHKLCPCPECGSIFANLKSLLIHQNDECLHWMRRPLFKCTFCLKYATSFQGLIRHIESNHVEIFFKCPLCQLAFRNNDAALEHSLQVHKIRQITYDLLHKCPYCKSVYSDKKMLSSHFESHYQSGSINIEKFVLACYKCSKPFDHCNGIRNHVKFAHDSSHTKIFSCDLCLSTLSNIELVLQHRLHCIKSYMHTGSAGTQLPQSEKSWKVTKTNQPLQKGSVDPNQPGKQFMCGECGEKFPTFNMLALRKHMMEKHLDKVKTAAANIKGQAGTKTASGNQTTARGSGHAAVSPNPPVNVTLPVKKKEPIVVERFTDLQCAKCQHKSSDRVPFEKHVTTHKTDEGLSQCHQCGLCFTVEESLRKHLFIKHKIKDMVAFNLQCNEIIKKGEEEMKKKKQEDREKEKKDKSVENEKEETAEEPEEEKKEDETEEEASQFKCKVCGAEFENDKTFAVHKRSHGLAYLQHQLSRSPEKALRSQQHKPTESCDKPAESPDVKPTTETTKSPAARSNIPPDTESSEGSDDSKSQNGGEDI